MVGKKDIETLIEIQGNVRGGVIKSDLAYIFFRHNEVGIKALEAKMLELGHPLNFDEIKSGEWYPESLSVLSILVAKELFHWEEKDVFDMGNSATKYSFISKIFMKYFLSLERFLKETPKYWGKHFDFGELKVAEFSEEERYIILHEKGYKFHPIMCIYHAGYYLGIAQFVIKSENINIKETKCVFKGAPYNEYKIKW